MYGPVSTGWIAICTEANATQARIAWAGNDSFLDIVQVTFIVNPTMTYGWSLSSLVKNGLADFDAVIIAF